MAVMAVTAAVGGDPVFGRELRQPFGEPVERSALAGRLAALSAGSGPPGPSMSRPSAGSPGTGEGHRPGGAGPGHVVTGHRRVLHGRE